MRTHLKRKEVDDVLGGKDSWANVDVVDGESLPNSLGHHLFSSHLRKEKIDEERRHNYLEWTMELISATCPACDKVVKANFMQLQIRSADEPMTTF